MNVLQKIKGKTTDYLSFEGGESTIIRIYPKSTPSNASQIMRVCFSFSLSILYNGRRNESESRSIFLETGKNKQNQQKKIYQQNNFLCVCHIKRKKITKFHAFSSIQPWKIEFLCLVLPTCCFFFTQGLFLLSPRISLLFHQRTVSVYSYVYISTEKRERNSNEINISSTFSPFFLSNDSL